MKLLIKNGRVIDPVLNIDDTLDILIDKRKIVEVNTRISDPGAKTIDAARLVVAPGFIDMHVHLREPGQEQKETIKTGALAASRGGFTSIACMPNTKPVNDHAGITKLIVSKAKQEAVVNVFPIAAVTIGSSGEQLTEMAELIAAGAVAFSDDGNPVSNSLVMRRALEYLKPHSAVVIDHCEDRDLSADGVAHEGENAYRLGLKGIPAASEEIMVARDIILAEEIQAPVHLAHLSTRGSIELLQYAKSKGIAVTAEVTPHHLILDDSNLETYNTNYKVNPPIRTREDVEAVISALRNGTIDVLATDHAPHTRDEKSVEFDLAPFGINGLETAVSLMLDKFVHKDIISLARLVEICSSNPARILGLKDKGMIKSGADADLTILNLNREKVIDVKKFASKSENSPFHGWKCKGMPVMTIVGGRIVYSA